MILKNHGKTILNDKNNVKYLLKIVQNRKKFMIMTKFQDI